jgi:antitoxin MazE
MKKQAITAQIAARGNELCLLLTEPMVRVLGVTAGSRVSVSLEPGQLIVEVLAKPSLDHMLANFDPQKHGGEVMADRYVGVELSALH